VYACETSLPPSTLIIETTYTGLAGSSSQDLPICPVLSRLLDPRAGVFLEVALLGRGEAALALGEGPSLPAAYRCPEGRAFDQLDALALSACLTEGQVERFCAPMLTDLFAALNALFSEQPRRGNLFVRVPAPSTAEGQQRVRLALRQAVASFSYPEQLWIVSTDGAWLALLRQDLTEASLDGVRWGLLWGDGALDEAVALGPDAVFLRARDFATTFNDAALIALQAGGVAWGMWQVDGPQEVAWVGEHDGLRAVIGAAVRVFGVAPAANFACRDFLAEHGLLARFAVAPGDGTCGR